MVDPKLRRILAASALVATISLAPVASANAAAVHARAHRAPVASSRIEAGITWLWDLVAEVLAGDDGVRIDPNGRK